MYGQDVFTGLLLVSLAIYLEITQGKIQSTSKELYEKLMQEMREYVFFL